MKTVNIHEAKTHFSKLIDAAVGGEPFIVAKAGKPMVRVTKVDAAPPQKLGFMQGQGNVPDDFDRMGAKEIEAMFEGRD